MLQRCLDSLRGQVEPDGATLHIIVVDNEADAPRLALVDAFQPTCPYPTTYVHQPKRGIAAARNAALDAAAAIAADWIAFIDDDEKAERDWIAQLMHRDYLDTPVLRGVNRFIYPIPRPFWAIPKQHAGREGRESKTATSGNVRFTAAIVRAGFRFDESLGLMGGEDNEFFTRVHAAGWQIKWTLRAVTYETAHPERLTWSGQFYRAYWSAASDARALAISRGWLGMVLRKSHTIPLHLIVGCFWLLASPLAYPFSEPAFKRMALNGGRTIAKGAGRAAAIVGLLPQPYRAISGH